jgi:hypothetical protein
MEKIKIDPGRYGLSPPNEERFVPIIIDDNRRESKARNEREEIIENIRERLNKDREGSKWKPLVHMAVKLKVKHLDDWDLKFLYDKCKRAKSFGSCFFWNLKTNK